MKQFFSEVIRREVLPVTLEKVIITVFALVLFTLAFIYRPVNAQLIILLVLLSAVYFAKRRVGKLKYIGMHLLLLLPFFLLLLSLLFVSHANIKVMEKELPTLAFPLTTFFLLNGKFRLTERMYKGVLIVFVVSTLLVLVYTSVRSLFYSAVFFTQNFLTFRFTADYPF
jgi:hypothetical protein